MQYTSLDKIAPEIVVVCVGFLCAVQCIGRISIPTVIVQTSVAYRDSMTGKGVEIRKSPLLFLRRLIGIEFFFALLPFVVLAVLNVRSEYESSQFAGALPYSLLLAIVMTTMQVVILAAVFVTWYIPVYQIDESAIVYRRGGLFGDITLADTPSISGITLRQGWLARRLNYGTLIISSSSFSGTGLIRDIPDPASLAELIQGLSALTNSQHLEPHSKDVSEIIATGENQYVEFKSSLMWDYRRQSANRDLYEPVMKNIAGFMNTRGGVVIVGVDDEGKILGLDPDISTLGKSNIDGFENALNVAFNKMIGAEFRRFVEVTFPTVGRDTLCLISVRPADEPAYVTHKGVEAFYIRAGNATQPLSVSKATRYISARFG